MDSPAEKPVRKRRPNRNPPPPHRSAMARIRISEGMMANKNASAESFADELAREYANDPEAAAWIAAHKDDLKTSNPDGSVPRSSQELIRPNELQLYNRNLVTDVSN